MSRHPSQDRSVTVSDGDGLAVIKEEQASPPPSNAKPSRVNSAGKIEEPLVQPCETYNPEEVKAILAKREAQLREQFNNELELQLKSMSNRFDFILQNEQLRSCYMLREAHRERKEKVQALQTQLECKNLSGLMYVLCSERRKCKLEKMKIIEDYTKYIHTLQAILTEGQLLILHLSRGYKTAARVDYEWREKMKSIIQEFQEYVYHFAGGTRECNQYIFDVPALLKTEASIVDDPEEDPCTCEEEEDEPTHDEEEPVQEKTWWERLDSDCRPFVMFGDMADFKPPKRREVIASLKAAAAKVAPAKWKEYVFNEMFLKSDCPNAEVIKDEYPKHLPIDKWECHANHHHHPDSDSTVSSRLGSRRATTNSIDMRSMGSILKIIASTNSPSLPPVKINLLGARDSMEIASTTRVREKRGGYSGTANSKNVSICLARTKSSTQYQNLEMEYPSRKESSVMGSAPKESVKLPKQTESDEELQNTLGNMHQDSLQVINSHKPEKDHKINYEKICPMEQCQRMQMDSFMRALPAYMRASPFTLFEQTFADYETCSPEQLEILKHRLDARRTRIPEEPSAETISDFEQAVDGVAVQTSEDLIAGLPPCTCRDPNPSVASSAARIFKVEDLIPMKEALDEITKECFHNNHILFDRFKVIGQEDSRETRCPTRDHEEFKKQRVEEIKNILNRHPSMLDLFQANARC